MDDALNFLGLLYRGQQIIIGIDLANAIKRGKIHALLLSEDISDKSYQEINHLAQEHRLPVTINYFKDELGQALGKSVITMVGFKSRKSYQTFLKKLRKE